MMTAFLPLVSGAIDAYLSHNFRQHAPKFEAGYYARGVDPADCHRCFGPYPTLEIAAAKLAKERLDGWLAGVWLIETNSPNAPSFDTVAYCVQGDLASYCGGISRPPC